MSHCILLFVSIFGSSKFYTQKRLAFLPDYIMTQRPFQRLPPPPSIRFSVYSPEITIYSCASRAVTLHLIIQNLFFGLVDEVVLQRQCNLMNLFAWKVSPRI